MSILLAEDVMRKNAPFVLPDDSLSSTLAKFAAAGLQELPVVRSAADRRILGTLAHVDVLSVYQDELLKADTPQTLSSGLSNLSQHPLEIAPGFVLAEWEPPETLYGQTLAQARLPDTRRVRVLLIKRRTAEGKVVTRLPSAQTVLSSNDVLVLLGTRDDIDRAAAL